MFDGVYSELIGVIRELSFPRADRHCVWLPGDATLTRIGCINREERTYFAVGPQPYLVEFMPAGRDSAH